MIKRLDEMTRQEFDTWIEDSRWILVGELTQTIGGYLQTRIYLTPGGSIISVNVNGCDKVHFYGTNDINTRTHQLREG